MVSTFCETFYLLLYLVVAVEWESLSSLVTVGGIKESSQQMKPMTEHDFHINRIDLKILIDNYGTFEIQQQTMK